MLHSQILQAKWEFSSAGSEHYLDKVGVTGSNPVIPTQQRKGRQKGDLFFNLKNPFQTCELRTVRTGN